MEILLQKLRKNEMKLLQNNRTVFLSPLLSAHKEGRNTKIDARPALEKSRGRVKKTLKNPLRRTSGFADVYTRLANFVIGELILQGFLFLLWMSEPTTRLE